MLPSDVVSLAVCCDWHCICDFNVAESDEHGDAIDELDSDDMFASDSFLSALC